MILIIISFISFVGGMMITIYINPFGFLLMLFGAKLKFNNGLKLGKIVCKDTKTV